MPSICWYENSDQKTDWQRVLAHSCESLVRLDCKVVAKSRRIGTVVAGALADESPRDQRVPPAPSLTIANVEAHSPKHQRAKQDLVSSVIKPFFSWFYLQYNDSLRSYHVEFLLLMPVRAR